VIAPPDGNMRAYLESLARLRRLSLDRIYPGHFRPLDDGRRVIDDYLEHRIERDRAILEVISALPKTVEEIVESVYADTPEPLRVVARYSVLAHLEMAEEDGRAARAGVRWRKTMGKPPAY
jgi:glyoxylase-like metal-dependent hydrolase (beta-lactamase superfamily II)